MIDEAVGIVRRKQNLAAANGVVPVSWEDMRKIDDALADLASLRQQLEQAAARIAELEQGAQWAIEDRVQIIKLQAALRKYGGHKEECARLDSERERCDCGFDSALSQEGP